MVRDLHAHHRGFCAASLQGLKWQWQWQCQCSLQESQHRVGAFGVSPPASFSNGRSSPVRCCIRPLWEACTAVSCAAPAWSLSQLLIKPSGMEEMGDCRWSCFLRRIDFACVTPTPGWMRQARVHLPALKCSQVRVLPHLDHCKGHGKQLLASSRDKDAPPHLALLAPACHWARSAWLPALGTQSRNEHMHVACDQHASSNMQLTAICTCREA